MVFHRLANGRLHPMEVVTGRRGQDQIQILSGLSEGQVVAASATFLIDAESNLASAMAGMAGMDHSGMDMGVGEEMEMDTSGMDMGSGSGEMDHSSHDTGGGQELDHSGHDMSGMAPDTVEAGDHSGMDHSGHDTSGMKPDTVVNPDTTGAGSRKHHEAVPGGQER